MPLFPSRAWADQAMALFNADPDSVSAGRGWSGDFGLVIEPEAGKLEAAFVAYLRPRDGRITELRILADPDDLDEFEPAYRVRAPYSVWKGLLQGTVDPVQAIVQRKLRVDGDVQPILERMRYKDVAARVLARLQTQFPDG
jgi:putative sterol carrier protein